jgi:hypothetical protein
MEDRLCISRIIAIENIYPMKNPAAKINASKNDSAVFSTKNEAPNTNPLYADKMPLSGGFINLENTNETPFPINEAKKMLKGSNKSVSKNPKPRGIIKKLKTIQITRRLRKRMHPR